MIARVWIAAFRLARGIMNAMDAGSRWVSAHVVSCLIPIMMPIYLLPALLAALLVGGLGMLVLAIVSAFTGSTRGPRGRLIGTTWAGASAWRLGFSAGRIRSAFASS
jgi:hypothetical protein